MSVYILSCAQVFSQVFLDILRSFRPTDGEFRDRTIKHERTIAQAFLVIPTYFLHYGKICIERRKSPIVTATKSGAC